MHTGDICVRDVATVLVVEADWPSVGKNYREQIW